MPQICVGSILCWYNKSSGKAETLVSIKYPILHACTILYNNCEMWQSRHVINLMHWHYLASQSLVDIVYWIMSSITQVTWELFSKMQWLLLVQPLIKYLFYFSIHSTVIHSSLLATFASRFNQKLVIYSSLLLGMEDGRGEDGISRGAIRI